MPVSTGAEILLEVLATEGVRHVFGNPGTTELPFIDALAEAADFEYVLALHEGTVVGMADGYAQATRRPSFVNLHTAPGTGNAMGNLSNVRATGTPMVLTAGQQHRGHLLAEPFLSGPLVEMASGLVKWAVEVGSAGDLGILARRAFHDAAHPPTGPVFLSIPMDVLEEPTDEPVPPPSRIDRRTVPGALDEAAARIVSAGPGGVVIVAGDEVASSDGLEALVAVAERLGCPVYGTALHSNTVFPTAHPLWAGQLPTTADGVRDVLSHYSVALLIGGRGFMTFAYRPSSPLPPGLELIHVSPAPSDLGRIYPASLAMIGDPRATLEALLPLLAGVDPAEAERLVAEAREGRAHRDRELEERAAMEAEKGLRALPAVAELMKALPPNSVVVDEAVTNDPHVRMFHRVDRGGRFFYSRGGALGWGMGAAIGVSLGYGREPVLCVVGDGSALYSPQALWTAARQRLPVVFAVMVNERYLILRRFLQDMKGKAASSGDYVAMDLAPPSVDHVAIARGFGVEGTRITNLGEIGDALRTALAGDGPSLLEIRLSEVD